MDEEQEPKAKKAMDEAEGEENKLTKAKPKSMLSEDVIYGIAEKMFFKKPFSNPTLGEIDLTKQNPYTIFMCHCQVHLNAMMAQFAKLKRIEFSKSNNGKDMVSFYKYKEGSNSGSSNLDIKDAFSGPYRVTKPMAFGVIEYGKLRVSAVQTTNYLKKEMKKTVSSTENDQIHHQQRPIQAFSSLFLDNDMSDSEDIAQNYALNIEHLEVNERADVIEANLRSLLSLDSLEIVIKPGHTHADSIFFGSSNQSKNIRCAATKTKKISVFFGQIDLLYSPIGDFDSFGLKWQRQVRFLIACCPSLERLELELAIKFPDHFILEHVYQHIRKIINAVRYLLEKLDGGGNSEKLHVSVDFTAICGCRGLREYQRVVQILRSLDNKEHEQIFTLGTPFVFDEYERMKRPYIARSLTIVDKTAAAAETGRSHLFKFKVYERMQTAKKRAYHYIPAAAHHIVHHPPHNAGQADLDSSSSDSADDEDEEEEDEEEQEDNDEEDADEDEQEQKEQQQPVAGTSKAAQNDEEQKEEEREEEPGKKKRARLI